MLHRIIMVNGRVRWSSVAVVHLAHTIESFDSNNKLTDYYYYLIINTSLTLTDLL